MRPRLLVWVAMLLVSMSCGENSETTPADDGAERTVEITMRDNAYEPASLEVRAGETVRFLFTNEGTVDHDAFIGDAAAQADHEAEVNETDADDHGAHDGGGDDAITVEPGDSDDLTQRFDQPGEFEIGCHEPGHYDAGMKIDITVS